MLLDRGMAKEALAAFEATKAKEPNRFHGLRGRRAWPQKSSATRPRRKHNYQKLVALTANADAERQEVAAASKYLASN